MKILVVSDVPSKRLWDYYRPEMLADIDLILSCGDLNPAYLSFLVTMAHCPLYYVRGNHDTGYDRRPPEGCDSVEGRIVTYRGIRILGLGGSYYYGGKTDQYTEAQMKRRVRKLFFRLRRSHGFDILLTHAPARGMNDTDHPAHRGFEVFNTLLDRYEPKFFIHGHVHLNYGQKFPRLDKHGKTVVINGYESYVFEYPENGETAKE